MTEPAILTLVGRPDCHLCHEMRRMLDRVAHGRLRVVETSVDEDERLLRLYQLAIPVLLFGTIEVARHDVSEQELVARLSSLGVLEPMR